MNNLPKGSIFKLIDNIPLKTHHTISKSIANRDDYDLVLFSMAEDTDISEEYYDDSSLFYVLKGKINIADKMISENNLFITKKNTLRGVHTEEDSIYIEIIFKGEDNMKNIEKGQVINLANSIEYVDGGVSNLDIVSRDDFKMMLMAFDDNQSLSGHAAPGDAMVIALEGRALLTVGDEKFEIEAGEQMIFPKGIIHNVESIGRFKMALVLVI